MEFFIEFYWYRYRNGIFYMKFIGIDTTVEFFTEFYWYRYRNGIFYVNVIGIDTTMAFFLLILREYPKVCVNLQTDVR